MKTQRSFDNLLIQLIESEEKLCFLEYRTKNIFKLDMIAKTLAQIIKKYQKLEVKHPEPTIPKLLF